MTNSTVANNTADGYNGTIYIGNTKTVDIVNALVHSNIGRSSGLGVYIRDADTAMVVNSTIANNMNDGGSDGLYIDMYSNSDSVLVMNSVIAMNKDYSSSTDDYELSGDEIGIDDGRLILINNYTNEDLYSGQAKIKRESGNIYSTMDPFTDLANGDFSLSNISDAIGSGQVLSGIMAKPSLYPQRT